MCSREAERGGVKDEDGEGGLTLASCLHSLQQRQIGHVTQNRHRHPLFTLRLLLSPLQFQPVKEDRDLSPHLDEGRSV